MEHCLENIRIAHGLKKRHTFYSIRRPLTAVKRRTVNIWSLTDWPVYYCRPSPVVPFLLPRQTDLMTLFYGLMALEPSRLNQNSHKYPLYTVSSYLTGNITSSLRRRTSYCCSGKWSLFIARINMKHVLTALEKAEFVMLVLKVHIPETVV